MTSLIGIVIRELTPVRLNSTQNGLQQLHQLQPLQLQLPLRLLALLQLLLQQHPPQE